MLRVACVLKSGGEYGPGQVALLRAGVRRWMQRTPHRFVCLTDLPAHAVEADEVLPLRRGWPGWWSKLELFDGRLTSPVLYFDLDTILTGPLDDIALGHRNLTVLENFWASDRIGSGMMAWVWDERLSTIPARFARSPDKFMREYRTTVRWGDQGFIFHNSPVPLDRWQRLHPGRVVSFKLHCMPAGRVPPGAVVVCFHGKPRPWRINPLQRRWFQDAGPVHGQLHVAGA
jgi:hypothetical protein